MRNGANGDSPIAPKRKKTANDSQGSVVAEYRRNKDGTFCGPYYYRYRYQNGRRTKTYLPREEGARRQAALSSTRSANNALSELLQILTAQQKKAEGNSRGRASPTGRYWHGSELRARRDFPVEERDRVLFNCNTAEIHADLGFPVSEDDYVELMARVRSELAKLSQRGVNWADGASVDVDMSDLSSWRDWREEEASRSNTDDTCF